MTIGAGLTIYNLLSTEEKVAYKKDPLAFEKALRQSENHKEINERADREDHTEPTPTTRSVFEVQNIMYCYILRILSNY